MKKTIRDRMIDIKPDGSFALDLKYFEFHTGLNTISPLFSHLLGQPARSTGVVTTSELQAAVTTEFSAISHVDYSSRLQTVTADCGSRIYSILDAFFQKTGCPMLLNTSFNVRGEPIVCTPSDAVDCFLNTHLDILAIGPCIVRKAKQKP